MSVGPVFAPIRAINNEYGNGRLTMGSVIALTNTVTTVNAAAVVNVAAVALVAAVAAAAVGAAYVAVVVGPVCKTPNFLGMGDDSRIGDFRAISSARRAGRVPSA
jgi:hypothetical protein